MRGRILTKPKLIDERRITFTFFDEEKKREISCQTAINDDAPAMLKKMEGWTDVAIDGIWIQQPQGGPTLMFRVETITPKTQTTKGMTL